jgi:predicted kinase
MEAVIFIGIQGTGKSTFYKEQFFHTHVRINLDMLKTKHRLRLALSACLEAGQPFVLDNMNVTKEVRQNTSRRQRRPAFALWVITFVLISLQPSLETMKE